MSRDDYARRRRGKADWYKRIHAGTSRLDRWRREGRDRMLERAREQMDAPAHAPHCHCQASTEAHHAERS